MKVVKEGNYEEEGLMKRQKNEESFLPVEHNVSCGCRYKSWPLRTASTANASTRQLRTADKGLSTRLVHDSRFSLSPQEAFVPYVTIQQI
jgi:hypothetical protein